MAGPIAHTFAAYATLITVRPQLISNGRTDRIAWGTAFVFGNMADGDFAVAYFTDNPVLQHHYFSHTFFAAAAVGLLCIAILKAFRYPHAIKSGALLGLLYTTHLILDYFTDDGSAPFGIPLLWPLSGHHFWSPVILFYATHRGGWKQILSRHNFVGLFIEIAILLPVVGLARFRAHRQNAESVKPTRNT